jgi:hypothetical protein
MHGVGLGAARWTAFPQLSTTQPELQKTYYSKLQVAVAPVDIPTNGVAAAAAKSD